MGCGIDFRQTATFALYYSASVTLTIIRRTETFSLSGSFPPHRSACLLSAPLWFVCWRSVSPGAFRAKSRDMGAHDPPAWSGRMMLGEPEIHAIERLLHLNLDLRKSRGFREGEQNRCRSSVSTV
jgi:hypothetical protein